MEHEMRIWHKDLIKLLPDEMVIDQLYDCMKIMTQISDFMTLHNFPAHVRKVMAFPFDNFYTYFVETLYECVNRKLNIDFVDFNNSFLIALNTFIEPNSIQLLPHEQIFQGWHTTRYLQQCILMLEELYDCDVINLNEWLKIANGVKNTSQLCEETYNNLFT